MSAAEMLILAATVLSLDGNGGHLDRGLVEGLIPGDRGEAYYELEVAGQVRRIEVGPIRIEEVTPRESRVAAIDGKELRPGYKVELRIPATRIRQRTLLEAARSYLDDSDRVEVSRALVSMVLEDEIFETVLAEELEARRPGSSQPAAVGPRPHDEVLVAAATYLIGLDHTDAMYHNQQPRHPVELRAFRIDRSPVPLAEVEAFVASRDDVETSPKVLQISWDLATDFCRSRGLRLPSEEEWETAGGDCRPWSGESFWSGPRPGTWPIREGLPESRPTAGRIGCFAAASRVRNSMPTNAVSPLLRRWILGSDSVAPALRPNDRGDSATLAVSG